MKVPFSGGSDGSCAAEHAPPARDFGVVPADFSGIGRNSRPHPSEQVLRRRYRPSVNPVTAFTAPHHPFRGFSVL